MLVKSTESKAAYAGSKVVLVNPRDTSNMCSRCSILVEKTLADRVHICPKCGHTQDRDWNSAINILRLGMQPLAKAIEAPPFRTGSVHSEAKSLISECCGKIPPCSRMQNSDRLPCQSYKAESETLLPEDSLRQTPSQPSYRSGQPSSQHQVREEKQWSFITGYVRHGTIC